MKGTRQRQESLESVTLSKISTKYMMRLLGIIPQWLLQVINNLKRDPLEIQLIKFENSRLDFIESVHVR